MFFRDSQVFHCNTCSLSCFIGQVSFIGTFTVTTEHTNMGVLGVLWAALGILFTLYMADVFGCMPRDCEWWENCATSRCYSPSPCT